jgi:hypothetical protein
MKSKILVLLMFLSLAITNSEAQECHFESVPSMRTRYVTPIYFAKVDYFFDEATKEAFASTFWEFDVEKTRDCFKMAKNLYPEETVLIPNITVTQVQLKPMGALDFAHIEIYPLANGHWSGGSRLIPISYKSKEMIAAAIKQGLHLVEFKGDPRMRLTTQDKFEVKKLDCTKGEMQEGAMNLFLRLSEIKTQVDSLVASQGVKTEEAMDEFFAKCLEFSNIETQSLGDFYRQHKLKTKIIPGEFQIMGYQSKLTYKSIPGIQSEVANIHEGI